MAVLRLIEEEKSVVEGAGATGLAALLSGQLDDLKGKKVVFPLCGGENYFDIIRVVRAQKDLVIKASV